MSPVDIAIVSIILVSALVGLSRGFIREVLSLASWIVAVYVAWKFAPAMEVFIEPYISQPPFRIAVAFTGTFVLVLIGASMVSFMLYRMFALTGISGIDRSLGALFGVARGVVVVGALILAAVYMGLSSQSWWQGANLVVYFAPVTDLLLSLIPLGAMDFKPVLS